MYQVPEKGFSAENLLRRENTAEEKQQLTDDELSVPLPPLQGRSKTRSKTLSQLFSSSPGKRLLNISVVILALYGLVSAVYRVNSLIPPATPKECACGNSTAEALKRGCKFDSLAAAWLPEHCREDELTAEFETLGPGPNGNWIYWADSNHTIEMTLEEIAALADDPTAVFHMSWEWHRTHCIFYWRKQFRSRTNGKIVEPTSDSEHHIMHCAEVIEQEVWGTKAGVRLNT